MIPFIRSLSELMAITEARDYQKGLSTHDLKKSSTLDSGQRKRYVRSIGKNKIVLPNVPKTFRNKWIKNKDHISKFIDDLDYHNQIQSSLDLILLERQNKNNRQDVA